MDLRAWAEQQKAALIEAGVHPLDAESAVQWVVKNLPFGADPNQWQPGQRLLGDIVNDAAITDSKSYWLSTDSVPQRYRMLLNATPVDDVNDGKAVKTTTAALLFYLFVRSGSRYYTQAPLRPVSQRSIIDLLDGYVSGEERTLAELVTLLHDGNIAPAVWQQQMQVALRRAHLNFRALGAGGYSNLTPNDLQRINDMLGTEYGRLANFARDIMTGNSSLAQSQVRTNMYIGTARIEFFEAQEQRLVAEPGSTTIARRLLSPADHCRSCLDYADMGWTRINDTPPPGVGSECRSNCRCRKIYRQVPTEELGLWLGSRRGRA